MMDTFLEQKQSYWVHIGINAYICCILLCILALRYIVCYLYKTFVNIDVINYKYFIEGS